MCAVHAAQLLDGEYVRAECRLLAQHCMLSADVSAPSSQQEAPPGVQKIQLKKHEPVTWASAVLRVMVNRKVGWQKRPA